MLRIAIHLLAPLRSRRGVAAIELALVVPALIAVTFGIIDVSSYVSNVNRLERTGAEVANVGTQFKQLRGCMVGTTGTEVGVLFAAAQQMIKPLTLPGASDGAVVLAGGKATTVKQQTGGMVVTDVVQTSQGPTIAWQAYSGVNPTSSRIGSGSATPKMPNGLTLRTGDDALFAELFYTYQPYLLSGNWTGMGNPTVVIYAVAVFRPRLGALNVLEAC